MKNILIVNDEYLVRCGLKAIIDWAGLDCVITGEAGNGREAFGFIEKNPVDIVVADIRLPEMDGAELTRKIKEHKLRTQIIILCNHNEFPYAQEAVKLGAFRYIFKTESIKTNLENALKSLRFNPDAVEASGQKSPGSTGRLFPEWNEQVEEYIRELYFSLSSSKEDGQASYSHIVKKCVDFIYSDYKNNIGLSEAAERSGVSNSYLSYIFKQETGGNFSAALTQHRIEEAKKLLATTTLKIYQIAEQVGFSNPYYFSKVFKKISGYSCKEYRNRIEG